MTILKIAFTGHRPNKLGNDYDLTSPRIQEIKAKIIYTLMYKYISSNNLVHIIVGGALGIDTLAALIAIEHNIPFTVFVPCNNQDKMWPKKSKDMYNYILSKAFRVYYVSQEEYNNHCMQDRNIAMVNACDVLISVWDGSKGGTANCVRYAQSIGKEVINIEP